MQHSDDSATPESGGPTRALTAMTKVEVVVAGEDVGRVRAIFERAGASGFTTVTNVSGLGHSGYHEGRLAFNDQDALALLFTVVSDDVADALVDALLTLLEHRPGVMFVTETRVSRPAYFER
jgi:nitrogen regulatory protein PII